MKTVSITMTIEQNRIYDSAFESNWNEKDFSDLWDALCLAADEQLSLHDGVKCEVRNTSGQIVDTIWSRDSE